MTVQTAGFQGCVLVVARWLGECTAPEVLTCARRPGLPLHVRGAVDVVASWVYQADRPTVVVSRAFRRLETDGLVRRTGGHRGGAVVWEAVA